MSKLAISNIAWDSDQENLELIASLGVKGIEVAPTKISNGSWDELSEKIMEEYRVKCDSFGLSIPSFQAFMFGRPELQLLGDHDTFKMFNKHIDYVARLANIAGAKLLVFGAPKNRLILDNDTDRLDSLLEARLSYIADTVSKYNVTIGLEAVPKAYGGEVITSYSQSIELVKKISHPGLSFHFDVGCTYLNGDDVPNAIEASKEIIRHFHISQPNLQSFSAPCEYHSLAAEKVKEIDYSGWLCIEMLAQEKQQLSLEEAIKFVKKAYC